MSNGTTYPSGVATMQEHAILIPRVSTSKQREEDQTPGLAAYAERKGYVIDAAVPIHGQSAFHGRQVKHVLAAVDEYVERGTATVVIFRHVDRSSREGAFEGYSLIRQIMEAGARVEFSEQEYLNNQPGMLGIFFEMAKAESEIKRDRKEQGDSVRSQAGKLVGRGCWGYDIVNDILVPNTIGREWIPRIYQAAADGRSNRSISTELDANGIPSPQKNGAWGNTSVRRMIINPTYKGDRSNKGEMEYEPLVSADLWARANLAMRERDFGGGRGRGTVTHTKALLRPFCGECYGVERDGCPNGQSPMYQTHSTLKGKKFSYYACKGNGPRHKACGAKFIPAAELDELVEWAVSCDITPHTTTVYHPAVDNTEAIKEISKRIRKADADGNDELLEALAAERAGLRLLGTIKPAWKEEKPSGMTRAQHYDTLDLDGKRELLAKIPFLARKVDGVTAFGIVMDDGSVNWISRTQAQEWSETKTPATRKTPTVMCGGLSLCHALKGARIGR